MESGSELRMKAEEEMIIEIEELREENRKLKEEVKLNGTKIAGIVAALLTVWGRYLWCLSSKASLFDITVVFLLCVVWVILGFYPSWKHKRDDMSKRAG